MANVNELTDREVPESSGFQFTDYKGSAEFESDEIWTPENIALAMTAVAEVSDETLLLQTMTAFNYSPLFRAAALDYGKDPAAAVAVGEMDPDEDAFTETLDNSFDLRLICSRMFHAGVLAQRHAESIAKVSALGANQKRTGFWGALLRLKRAIRSRRRPYWLSPYLKFFRAEFVAGICCE